MKKQMLALAAITAMGLSAQAQLFNWTLTTSGDGNPGNGSGQLQVTTGVITSMSGSIGSQSLSLSSPYTLGGGGNDNHFPINGHGFAVNVNNFGLLNIYQGDDSIYWGAGMDGFGYATFTATPVPEPSTWLMAGVFGVGAVATVRMRRRQTASV
jgi:hypothetical protein